MMVVVVVVMMMMMMMMMVIELTALTAMLDGNIVPRGIRFMSFSIRAS
jgi:hypothetical protein